MQKSRSLKETCVLWSKRTDVNCYNKIFEYENFCVKTFWLFMFLASLGVTAWIISWTVLAYLQYNVVSQIDVVDVRPTQFPAVTLCDYNPYTTQQALNLLNSFYNSSKCLYAASIGYWSICCI